MPQIRIPERVHPGVATQQGIAGLQNAMVTRARLDTAGLENQQQAMQNQEMDRGIQKRNELEAVLSQSQNPERDGYEWAKRNDPELSGKLAANYIKRFSEKARLDPKNAAAELENATGEKIELGNRYAKLPFEGVEAYVDNFTGHVFQPSNAKEMADIRNDFSAKLETLRQEGRKELEGVKAELGSDKLKQQQGFTAVENEKDRAARLKAAGIAASRPPASLKIYDDEDIDSWVQAVETGQAKITDIPYAVRGKVNSRIQKGGNLNIPPKIREAVNGVDRAIALVAPAEDLLEKIIAGEDRVINSALLENYTNSIATLLSRSLGERGVATEGDVNRAKGLVAGWKSANFIPEFGRREMGMLKGLLNSQKNALTKDYFKKIPRDGGGGAAESGGGVTTGKPKTWEELKAARGSR